MTHIWQVTLRSSAMQGSYSPSIVKFPDFSLTFQVVEWQFPWPYRNNNPIAQMLEMVDYIQRFEFPKVSKNETCRLWCNIKCSYGVWGNAVSSPAGSGAEPQRKTNLMHFNLEIWHVVASVFHFRWLLQKNIFPWPFPDQWNSATFSSFPWPAGTLATGFRWRAIHDLYYYTDGVLWEGMKSAERWAIFRVSPNQSGGPTHPLTGQGPNLQNFLKCTYMKMLRESYE